VLRDDGVFWLNIGDSYVTKDYAPLGLKPKDQAGIPHRLYFALQQDGWYGRSDTVWHKPNPGPSSVQDRPVSSHEYFFLLAKSAQYFYDQDAIREPSVSKYRGAPKTRSKRTVWKVPVVGFNGKEILTDIFSPDGKALERDEECPIHGDDPEQWWDEGAPLFQHLNEGEEPECTCEEVKSQHFATMPPKLATPAILAGSSEFGRCMDCGKPVNRIVEVDTPKREKQESKKDEDGLTRTAAGLRAMSKVGISTRTTVGCEKACDCEDSDTGGCIVLDPFNGVGTTGIVALTHGRSYIGIELNPDYAKIARRRFESEGH
jgi:DNA modification methylase